MKLTGNFRARGPYRDLLGERLISTVKGKNSTLKVTIEEGGVGNVISHLPHTSEVFLKYFEPQYEFSDGKRFFPSDRLFNPIWYIENVGGVFIHNTYMSYGEERANEGNPMKSFDSKEDAEKYLIDKVK